MGTTYKVQLSDRTHHAVKMEGVPQRSARYGMQRAIQESTVVSCITHDGCLVNAGQITTFIVVPG